MNDFVRDKFRQDDGRIELKYEILAGMTVSFYFEIKRKSSPARVMLDFFPGFVARRKT